MTAVPTTADLAASYKEIEARYAILNSKYLASQDDKKTEALLVKLTDLLEVKRNAKAALTTAQAADDKATKAAAKAAKAVAKTAPTVEVEVEAAPVPKPIKKSAKKPSPVVEEEEAAPAPKAPKKVAAPVVEAEAPPAPAPKAVKKPAKVEEVVVPKAEVRKTKAKAKQMSKKELLLRRQEEAREEEQIGNLKFNIDFEPEDENDPANDSDNEDIDTAPAKAQPAPKVPRDTDLAVIRAKSVAAVKAARPERTRTVTDVDGIELAPRKASENVVGAHTSTAKADAKALVSAAQKKATAMLRKKNPTKRVLNEEGMEIDVPITNMRTTVLNGEVFVARKMPQAERSLKEIAEATDDIHLVMARTRFQNLVGEILQDMLAAKVISVEYRFKPTAIAALMVATESYIVDVFVRTQNIADRQRIGKLLKSKLDAAIKADPIAYVESRAEQAARISFNMELTDEAVRREEEKLEEGQELTAEAIAEIRATCLEEAKENPAIGMNRSNAITVALVECAARRAEVKASDPGFTEFESTKVGLQDWQMELAADIEEEMCTMFRTKAGPYIPAPDRKAVAAYLDDLTNAQIFKRESASFDGEKRKRRSVVKAAKEAAADAMEDEGGHAQPEEEEEVDEEEAEKPLKRFRRD